MSPAKFLSIMSALLVATVLSFVWAIESGKPEPTPKAFKHACELARMDAGWVVEGMTSPNLFERSAVAGVYDKVLLEQRVCALFSTPIRLSCSDDGCRAAALLTGIISTP